MGLIGCRLSKWHPRRIAIFFLTETTHEIDGNLLGGVNWSRPTTFTLFLTFFSKTWHRKSFFWKTCNFEIAKHWHVCFSKIFDLVPRGFKITCFLCNLKKITCFICNLKIEFFKYPLREKVLYIQKKNWT